MDRSPSEGTLSNFWSSNTVTGHVAGPIVQAAEVHGDVHVHGSRSRGLPFRFGSVPPRAHGYRTRDFDLTAPCLVLSGIGGVGKTQLAAEIAREAWESGTVQVLVWITASSRRTALSDFAWCAAELLDVDVTDSERAAAQFLNWLNDTAVNWLVVLDDMWAPGDLNGLWPEPSRSGQVIVTTRRRDAALAGHERRRVDVTVFTATESTAFLQERLEYHPGLAVGAERLTVALGHLPLALAQAGAYIVDRGITCEEYLRRFTERRRTLAALSPEADSLPDQQRSTMATTWALSVDFADQLEPRGLATPLLRLAAMLSPQGIPSTLFAAPDLLAYLSTSSGRQIDAEQSRDALRCLHRLSLATYTPDNSLVMVHTLVQRVTRDDLEPEEQQTVALAVAGGLQSIWDEGLTSPALSRLLYDNADTLFSRAKEHLSRPRPHELLFVMGNSRGDMGFTSEASRYFALLHDATARRLGVMHPDSLLLRYAYAYWSADSMEPVSGLLLLRAVVDKMKRALGEMHPYSLKAGANIAPWEARAGGPRQAIAMLNEYLPRIREVFGEQSELALTTMTSLAFWQGEAGLTQVALATMDVYFSLLERKLGAEHPSMLVARHNKALLIGDTGDYSGAIALMTEVLSIQTRLLGPDHPDVFRTRHNLAFVRGRERDPRGAADELRVLWEDEIRVRGQDHPDVRLTRAVAAKLPWESERRRRPATRRPFPRGLPGQVS